MYCSAAPGEKERPCRHENLRKIGFLHDEQVLICFECCTHLPDFCLGDWADDNAVDFSDAFGGVSGPAGLGAPQTPSPTAAVQNSPEAKRLKKWQRDALEMLITLADRYHFAANERDAALDAFLSMCTKLSKNFKQGVGLAVACLYLTCRNRKVAYLVEPVKDIIGIKDFWTMWKKVEKARRDCDGGGGGGKQEDRDEFTRMWTTHKGQLSKIMSFPTFMELAKMTDEIIATAAKQRRTVFATLLYLWGSKNRLDLSRRFCAQIADVSPSSICRLTGEMINVLGGDGDRQCFMTKKKKKKKFSKGR